MKKHPIAALEVLNRRRLVRRNFLTDYLGGNEQNRRKEVSDLASMEYLTCYPPDGNGTLERSYPRQFFRIYAKGLKADRALKAAGIEPIKHPDIGEQFWHQMLIDDIVMSFEIACRQQGLPFKDQYEILGDDPLELPCHITFTFPSSGKTHTSDKALCPDALFAIGETYFALEADRGTEPIERSNLNQTSYLRKFLQYADVLKSGRYKTVWQIPNLMVLHVSTRELRTKALRDFMDALGAKSQSQCFKSAPSLSSTAKAPRPLTTLLTDPYDRVGHPPFIIGEKHERTH
jgi:Replication-relaxation